MRCTGRRAHILSISLTDPFQPTERQLSTRFGGGVPRRWRRLDSSSNELSGAAGGCEVNAFVGAVAERFRVGLAAAAERDCDVVHCSSCLWCTPARRMRAGAPDGGLVSGREVAREGRG